MDAISAATNKKEVRKRKRIPSAKDSENAEKSASAKPASKEASKTVEAAPLRFYQDTLTESDAKDEIKSESMDIDNDAGETKEIKPKKEGENDDEIKAENEQSNENTSEETEDEPMEEVRQPGIGCGPNGPPGVLTIHRRKNKPKKSIRWKPQESLEEIRYFELDETERVNVTKTFFDMKQMERVSEREAFLIKKNTNEDTMTEQMAWAPLILIEDVPEHQPGSGSKEKDVQAEREKTCLKTIYFNRSMIPDSPSEPDVIAYQNVEPQTIPLYDVTGNPDAVHDFTNMPWPEAKASPPHQASAFEGLTGLQNYTTFGQLTNNVNWPLAPQQNNMAIRPPQLGPFGQMMPSVDPLQQLNPMQQFNAAMMPPQFQNNLGFMNNFGQPLPNMVNDNRANRNNNWFGAPNSNWQPQPASANSNNNNNNNQRANWTGNRRICKQFQRGFCRHGDKCKFLHPGVNTRPQF